jgi:transposase-like protein
MARQRRRFSPEFREEAVRLVIENSRPMAHVARELGMGETTLSKWVIQYRNEHTGDEPTPLATHERIRLAELERELREVRLENEFLKKAAAYFARDPR